MRTCKRPRISVGVPVYNGERFLAETLDALLGQSYEDFELIISDNASSDRTEEICRDYAARDARVRYHRGAENRGAAWNWGRVFKLSTGQYFRWASADDLCTSEYLERCLAILESDPSVILACARTRFIDEEGNPLDLYDAGWDLRSPSAAERMRFAIGCGGWVNAIYGLIPSAALAETRLLAGYAGGDYRVLGELCLMGKFHQMPEYMLLRRIHAGASGQNANSRRWMTYFYLGRSQRLSSPFLARSYDHFITILKSDRLALREKMSLTGRLLRIVYWNKSRIVRELNVS